jgi:hypothetical protein
MILMVQSAWRRWASAAVLAVPLTLTACDACTGKAQEAGQAAAEGESWIVVTEGKVKAEPAEPVPAQPEPEPEEPHLPELEPVELAEVHRERCVPGDRHHPGLTVEPGAGAGTVTWYNAGDPSLESYRLAAIPQNLVAGHQPPVRWQTIPAGAGCRTMTAIVRDLDRRAPYIFWLDAVRTSPGLDGNRTNTIARSLVVQTR